MPVLKNKDDEDNNTNLQQSAGTNQGFGTGQAMGAAPQQTPKGTSSGRFTNIQNYLGANKQSGQQLAQNIGGQLADKGQAVKQDLNQANNQFNQQSTAGRLDREKVLPEAGQIVDRAGQSGYGSDVDRFKRISSGQYQGPQGIQNAANLNAQGGAVESLGRNLGNSGGRTQVLGQLFGGKGGYSSGQRKLDDLLLGQNAGALAQARGATAGITNSVNQKANAASGLASYYGQEAADVGSASRKNLTDTDQNYFKMLQDKLQNTRSENDTFNTELKQTTEQLGQGQLQRDAATRLGLDSIGGANIYNLNLGDYTKTDFTALPSELREVASRQEALRKNALMKLGGEDVGMFDPEAVDTYKKSTQSFDLDRFLLDAENRKAELARETRAATNLEKAADVSFADWNRGADLGDFHKDFVVQQRAVRKWREQNLANLRSQNQEALNWARSGGYNLGNELELRQFARQAAGRRDALQGNRKLNLID